MTEEQTEMYNAEIRVEMYTFANSKEEAIEKFIHSLRAELRNNTFKRYETVVISIPECEDET